MPAEPIKVDVNRPFIFLIRDIKTGTNLLVLLTTFLTPISILSTWSAVEERVKDFMLFFLLLARTAASAGFLWDADRCPAPQCPFRRTSWSAKTPCDRRRSSSESAASKSCPAHHTHSSQSLTATVYQSAALSFLVRKEPN
jgi:hypothetical protein